MDTAQIVNDLPDLISLLDEVRQDKRLVCTIGSWDILHQGHIEYLKRARGLGDILVVGVDSDLAYQRYKGKHSMYQQDDRQNIVSALRYVDYVTIVDDVDNKGEWQMTLVKSIMPDVFVYNDQSYSEDQRKKLDELCPTLSVPFYSSPNSSSSAYVSEEMKLIVRENESKIRIRIVAFYFLGAMFFLSILTTIAMIILEAFGISKLSSDMLYTLISATIAELAAILYIVYKYLFPAKERITT